MKNLTVQQQAENVIEIIKSIGFDCSDNFSVSNTDYGTSCYLRIYTDKLVDGSIKVRVSDHSVSNPFRMSSEILIDRFYNEEQIKNALLFIEQIVFPERFKTIDNVVSFTKTMEINAVNLQSNDEIIAERIAKSGKLHFTVKRTEIINGVKKVRI